MDTYRIPLPQPQPVTNEEEFVTNSGRRMKNFRDSLELSQGNKYLKPNAETVMLGSGVSVLSPSPGTDSLNLNSQDLTDSVQAELHLSLERLSENFDPEELKRLQEKSKSHRDKLSAGKDTGERKQESEIEEDTEKEGFGLGGIFDCICKAPQTGDAEDARRKQENTISKDSLDADSASHSQYESEELSGESEEYEDEDEHTVVADSLDFTSVESLTPLKQTNSELAVLDGHSNLEDKYADLRYDPNWVRSETRKPAGPPIVIDFTKAKGYHGTEIGNPEEVPGSHRGGGAIILHKQDLFSPSISSREGDHVPQASTRSISLSRLSSDTTRMKNANALYEDEFKKLLRAEIHKAEEESKHKQEMLDEELQMNHAHPDAPVPEQEDVWHRGGDGVLIRGLDAEDPRSNSRTPDQEALVGGYRVLPERHRVITPPTILPSKNAHTESPHADFTVSNESLGRQQAPRYFAGDKKDPLEALSPRTKTRSYPAPTPPRAPKPKNQKDYIELNRLRIGRKTNSAGYLDLHTKRAQQAEKEKARSYSELKGTIKKQMSTDSSTSPTHSQQHTPTTIEDIWMKQAERLKIAKGENVNKGKTVRPPPQHRQQERTSRDVNTFLVSPRHEGNHASQIQNHSEPKSLNQDPESGQGGLYTRMQQQNTRTFLHDFQRQHHPLPLPSEQMFFPPHPHQTSRLFEARDGSLRDSLNEDQIKQMFHSPQRNYGEQESPLLRAYNLQYGPGANVPAQNGAPGTYFTEQNPSIPPRRSLSHPTDIWTNSDSGPMALPPTNYSPGRNNGRKVTFLGDNESLTIEGLTDDNSYVIPTQAGGAFEGGRHKLSLPPTPPAKSQHHSVNRYPKRESLGKENISLEDFYNVKQGSYPILPPILKSHQKTNPLKHSPNGKERKVGVGGKEADGYLEQHEKQKRKPQYKIYTLDDYKNLKKDVKLGGLGPDLESARAKVEKAERARKYAEFIRMQHKMNAVVKNNDDELEEMYESYPYTLNHHFSATIDDKLRQAMYEKRKRAIEYSKKVPRPKVKPNAGFGSSMQKNPSPASVPISSPGNYSGEPSPTGEEDQGIDFNWGILQMLKERHEKEKAQVAAFSGTS